MDEIKDFKEPEKDPVEEIKEQIYKQDDVVQYLVRPLKNNPFGNFSEEIIESKSLGKRVKTEFIYEDVLSFNKLVGKALKNSNRIVEDI